MARERYSINNVLDLLNCDDSDAGDSDNDSSDEEGDLGLIQVTWPIVFVLL